MECPYTNCKRTFSKQSGLTQHIKYHHPSVGVLDDNESHLFNPNNSKDNKSHLFELNDNDDLQVDCSCSFDMKDILEISVSLEIQNIKRLIYNYLNSFI